MARLEDGCLHRASCGPLTVFWGASFHTMTYLWCIFLSHCCALLRLMLLQPGMQCRCGPSCHPCVLDHVSRLSFLPTSLVPANKPCWVWWADQHVCEPLVEWPGLQACGFDESCLVGGWCKWSARRLCSYPCSGSSDWALMGNVVLGFMHALQWQCAIHVDHSHSASCEVPVWGQ